MSDELPTELTGDLRERYAACFGITGADTIIDIDRVLGHMAASTRGIAEFDEFVRARNPALGIFPGGQAFPRDAIDVAEDIFHVKLRIENRSLNAAGAAWVRGQILDEGCIGAYAAQFRDDADHIEAWMRDKQADLASEWTRFTGQREEYRVKTLPRDMRAAGQADRAEEEALFGARASSVPDADEEQSAPPAHEWERRERDKDTRRLAREFGRLLPRVIEKAAAGFAAQDVENVQNTPARFRLIAEALEYLQPAFRAQCTEALARGPGRAGGGDTVGGRGGK